MASFYDEIEIEDMEYDEDSFTYFYPCPCGDRFEITLDELKDGDDVAKCPSCSLLIRIIYDPDDLPDDDEEEVMLLGTSIVAKSDPPIVAVQPISKAPVVGDDEDKAILVVSKLAISVDGDTTPDSAQRSGSSTPNVDDEDGEDTAIPLSAEIAVS
ncbi:Diphthamide biosynthesis protein 3 [Coemansia sp. S16]|nr:Diphthamide biosynthesis protein 3 [Coemansia sp. S17]KAJ2014843.1 Diphthamide biosynthesis protein 3 [Coemansia sp. S680]KAJ2024031.1 Diphthamide biosynthesis protein 3 [Coemansia sp. S3946]KAJ2044443.1 Diphthamide biosynthesis protein 3 [Coemansia sp. S16]KAJ2050321.1 Diphthamide biosynthesis protein 3 [Coemansia sp. S2]KAJ2071185.1 Diphthamide biosynthesis protein 3 [Coemansia sp. S155-1]KAJ2096314.1 Diphthamide biosynthesis protein 3 [Coemansia sp. S100]KAJ2408873.1 Diphthamide biosyn